MATRREITVGAFVIAGFLLFLAFTVSLRNLDFLSNRHTYYIYFDKIERLEPGAAVLFYGAPAGAVSNIQIVGGAHPIMVTIRIDKTVVLHPGTEIRVVPAAVIGETTVNIDSAGDEKKPRLEPGGELIGKAPATIETTVVDLSERINTVLDQLTPTLSAINKLVGDKANQEHARQILENFANASANLDKTLKAMNEQVRPIIEDLHKVPIQLQSFLDHATSATQQFDAAARSWNQAGQQLNSAVRSNSAELQRTIDRLSRTVTQSQKPIDDMIANLNRSAERLNQIIEGIQKGQGTLGALLTDPRPFDQLRELLNSLSSSLTGRRQQIVPFPQENQKPGRLAPAPQGQP
ncbi:MlaD family protein [bacterium]|nr:MlaD family protein [bacterium]